MGGLQLELLQNGEWWRLLSCLWLHAGAIHLIANMISLLFMGIRLEEEFGFCKSTYLAITSVHLNQHSFLSKLCMPDCEVSEEGLRDEDLLFRPRT